MLESQTGASLFDAVGFARTAASSPRPYPLTAAFLPLPDVQDDVASPLVICVAHAGRLYSDTLRAALRHPQEPLCVFEDRYVDLLVDHPSFHSHRRLIATYPRLWIDLNRSETDRDPLWVYGRAIVDARIGSARPSARARLGFGLIPTYLPTLGPLWRTPIAPDDLRERILTVHRPFHEALAHALAMRCARFGQTILIDLHSMPPLVTAARAPPQIVIGDRHGASASPALRDAAVSHFRDAGYVTLINSPYAGGDTLARHARPSHGRHALQVEVDRNLYLNPEHTGPGPGFLKLQVTLAGLCQRLAPLINNASDPCKNPSTP